MQNTDTVAPRPTAEELDKLTRAQLQEVVNTMILKRKALKLRQYQLADKAGVSSALINILENGYGAVKLDSLMRVARALGLRINLSVEDMEESKGKDS